MRRRSIVCALAVLGSGFWFSGCGSLPVASNTTADEYLGETVSLGEARVLAVIAGGLTQSITTLTFAADLLTSATEDAELSIDPSQMTVQVVPPEFARGRQSSNGLRQGSAQVTFRFAPVGQDACTSDRVVGPFTLTIERGRVRFDPPQRALGRVVRDMLRNGQVSVCVEVEGDFDGTLFVREVSFSFDRRTDKVELCHRSHIADGREGDDDDDHDDDDRNGDNRDDNDRDDDNRDHDRDDGHRGDNDRDGDDRNGDRDDDDGDDDEGERDGEDRRRADGERWHTIRVGLAAVAAHLAHGDTMGPCGNPDAPLDIDGDGVHNEIDACAETPGGEVVGPDGCSCSQSDTDADSVNDCTDDCPGTAAGSVADDTGCSCAQRDADADSVSDCDDVCPATPSGEAADARGCSCSQRDGDGDAVTDCTDACSDTPSGDRVDADGCSLIILAADAGPDVAAVEGDIVDLRGAGSLVQGNYDAARMTYRWTQSAGPTVALTDGAPSFSVDTTGIEADITLQLTVSTDDGTVSASDEVTISVRAANIVHVASGTWHNTVVYENNRARLWGWNRHNELGDGTILRNVVSVDTGPTFTLFAKTDGTAWVMGTSPLSASAAPMQVSGVDNVVQVAAIVDGGLFLRADGSVWGFVDADNRACVLGGAVGAAVNGVLGPIQVPGLPGDIVRLASAGQHTIALGADGRAWVWGGSRYGCVPFVALSNVAAVAAGDTNLCLFLRNDGTAWAMGFNFQGQLGNGTTTSNYRTPTQALGMSGIVAIAAGNQHSLFVKGDGTVWASGWNHDCQLGLGSGAGESVRVPSQVLLTGAAHVAGGSSQSVTIGADNSVWAWGMNNVGQLTGTTATPSPGSSACAPLQIRFP